MRLLIVEDEVPLATSIARGLGADGFACDVVHDGADGLAAAQTTPYAAIVLDLLLPSMNGFAVCRALRDGGTWTPVLILTAKDGDHDLAEALDCGADDFVSKPFSFVVLTARLRALIRRGHVPRPPALENGTLRLDPFTRSCTADGRTVELTPRESSVLAALMRRHPGVIGKEEVLDEVWGPEFTGDANIVDVYIGHLRRKLTAVGATVRIANVRGLGFRTEVAAPGSWSADPAAQAEAEPWSAGPASQAGAWTGAGTALRDEPWSAGPGPQAEPWPGDKPG